MQFYHDIDPMDLDPDTGRPYANYSSPALDTSFHDHEMDVDEAGPQVTPYDMGVTMCAAGLAIGKNPYDSARDREAFDCGWREQAASEMAVRCADLADEYGDCVNDRDY